ncbi:MAG: metallophosphoesterase [Clostridia bacterium]
MKRFFLIFILSISCFFLYARYINTTGLKINEASIESTTIPKSFNGFKIAHFSDTLLGNTTNIDTLKNIVKKINNSNPDLIVFTGDLISKEKNINEEEKETIINEFKSLKSSTNKYAVIGDNDEVNIDEYKDILEKSGFILLDNKKEYLFYKDITPIKVIGVNNKESIDTLLTNEEGIYPTFTLALTHKSDNINFLKDKQIDVVLSGNSLGGLIRIPFIGGIIKKEGSKTYIDSYYEVNNTKLYVSNGIGTEKLKLRSFNTPSISIYRINAK